MNLVLHDYQEASIDALRAGIRAGHNRQVLAMPTGSGKTIVSTFLMQEVANKMSRAIFVCDRVALVDQTSAMFDAYGISHGCLQAQHWRTRPYERIQVASAQTIARRGVPNVPQLLIWDECHTLYKSIVDYIAENPTMKVIGLSATPFTKGLGKIFTNIVNVTTTDKLIEQGFLSAVKVYAAKPIDMFGAAVKFNGEWEDKDVEYRAMTVVGDIVSEWIAKTSMHFGGPVKTLVFSASVAHGAELCRRFQESGFNFQQISYKDGNDDARKALISDFRKPDSEIVGLISCEVLGKGADFPDVRCGISARPYRKSLSGHIQQIGRVMRSHPGKDFALWLDHSNNFLRFFEDTQNIFANGIPSLDENGLDAKLRPEPSEKAKKDNKCGGCGYVMSGPTCPSCGWERPARAHAVEEISGDLHEISLKKSKASALDLVLVDKDKVWRQICHHALERKSNEFNLAERFAKAQYRSIYGTWPRLAMRNITPEPCCDLIARKINSQLIAWSRRRA